jgi:hypothetical protein
MFKGSGAKYLIYSSKHHDHLKMKKYIEKYPATTVITFSVIIAALILSICFIVSCHQNQKTWYLWTSHRDERDGLHLAVSPDGMNWTMIKNDESIFTPGEWILRDPAIARDGSGTYHLLWTVAWSADEIKAVGYSKSNDLVHWEKERFIPVMENEPETQNVWAPELFWDLKNKDWIITWSSTVRGKFARTAHIYGDNLNGRIYYTKTKDFLHFTPSSLLFDPDCIAIDQTIYEADDSTFYVFFKADRDTTESITDKTTQRGILYVKGSSPAGPFTVGPGIINKYREKNEDGLIEGPSLMKVGNDLFMYYGAGDYCGAYKTSDMKSWIRITDSMTLPNRYMHGTVIKITEIEAKRLLLIK